MPKLASLRQCAFSFQRKLRKFKNFYHPCKCEAGKPIAAALSLCPLLSSWLVFSVFIPFYLELFHNDFFINKTGSKYFFYGLFPILLNYIL